MAARRVAEHGRPIGGATAASIAAAMTGFDEAGDPVGVWPSGMGHEERDGADGWEVMRTYGTYVVELPRRARPLFEGAIAACLRFMAGRASPGMTRLALMVSVPPPDEAPDVVVCVPALAFGAWEERAAEVVAAWESRWLLIESMGRRHRDEARADLHHAVASALVAAAIAGVDDAGAPDDLGF